MDFDDQEESPIHDFDHVCYDSGYAGCFYCEEGRASKGRYCECDESYGRIKDEELENALNTEYH